MARRSHVPKFGNWDANDHMPYTVVFDHARQGRGKPMNPNDPAENPNLQPAGRGNGAPGRRPFNPNDPEDAMEGADLQQERERPPVQGGPRGQPHQTAAAAAAAATRRASPVPQVQSNGPPSRVSSGDPKRTSKENVEAPSTSLSADQSPSHSSGRGTRLGAASPAWETRRKSASGEEGQMFAPPTPNRSRLRTSGNSSNKEEAPKGPTAALPKFGAWDAQDPGSGDGFTVIFNNARNEKKTGGPVNIPRTPDQKNADLYEPSNVPYQKPQSARKSWFCCGSQHVNP